jgi:predicted HTH transcriptional regulator
MSNKTENLITQGESQNIEFKDSLSLKREIGETVSAFSNTNTFIVGKFPE